jgi:1,4-alpha-glucan branching enzyme
MLSRQKIMGSDFPISSEIKKKKRKRKKGIWECFSPCMGSGDLISFVN